MIKIARCLLTAVLAAAYCSLAAGQVVSLTLQIEVNSPYGLSEPWFTIRNGLLRHPGVESVAERPNLKAHTGTVTTKEGRLLTPDELGRAVRECGAGASLRAVEAVIDGMVTVRSEMMYLKVPDAEIRLRPLAEAETGAYERLKKESKPVRVSGLLTQEANDPRRRTFVLEVRSVETLSKTLTSQLNL